MRSEPIEHKENELIKYLLKQEKIAIAFSGGVDSTYLLDVAAESRPGNVIALTARSPLHSDREQEAALSIASRLGVSHYFVETDPLGLAAFVANTHQRCYYCKKQLFGALQQRSFELGYPLLLHGANLNDQKDFRPGQIAATELNVPAPLMDARLTKADIRQLSRKRGLETWNKAAMACLATRIPYGRPVTKEVLRLIEAAEDILIEMGFAGCRVRWHEKTARIEAPLELMPKFLEPQVRPAIVKGFQKLGFSFISLDMQGYVQGSMNRELSDV